MADLRDIRDSDEPVILSQPLRDDVVIVDDGGLGNFHVNGEAEEDGARRSKLFAGLAVAVLVGMGGAYGVSQYMKNQPVVADENLPAPSAPSKTAAMTPPPAPAPQEPAMQDATPSATTPAPSAMAPAAPDVVRPAPVTKQAAVSNAPKVMATPRSSTAMNSTAMNAPVLPPPSEQYTEPAVTPAPSVTSPVENQASNVPEAVSPTPPASAQAGNPPLNQQSAEPAPEAAQPAPEAAPAAPAPEAAPAQ